MTFLEQLNLERDSVAPLFHEYLLGLESRPGIRIVIVGAESGDVHIPAEFEGVTKLIPCPPDQAGELYEKIQRSSTRGVVVFVRKPSRLPANIEDSGAIHLVDELPQIWDRPDIRSLVADQVTKKPSTKWQRFVDEIESDPDQLGDYFPTFMRDLKECHEGFEFKHDAG